MASIEERDYYTLCKNSANSYRMLYHYTSLEALLHIINSREFRLSHISLLNDPLEYERLDPFIRDKIFVACFNHIRQDAIPLWEMYANGPYGLRIAIPQKYLSFFHDPMQYAVEIDGKHRSLKFVDNWSIWDTSILNVIYDNNFGKYHYNPKYLGDDGPDTPQPNAVGHLKKKCWQFEKETRVRVGLKYNGLGVKLTGTEFEYFAPPFKYIYCKIPNATLQNMQIMFSPMMSEIVVNLIKREIKTLVAGFCDNNFVYSDIQIKKR